MASASAKGEQMALLPLIGSAIGALGSFFGGQSSQQSALKMQQQAFAQNQASIFAAEQRALADRPNIWAREDQIWQKENQAALNATNQAQQFALEAEARAAARDATKIQTLVNDARAAGIHPLAAMGVSYGGPMAQAVQGSTPSHSSASGTVDRQAAQMGAPVAGDPIGDALGKFGLGLAEMQGMRLTEAQIRNVEASTANILSEAQSRSMIMNARLNGQSLNSTRFTGETIRHDPRTDDAQKAANRYGEPGDWLFGMYNLFNDSNALMPTHKSHPGAQFGNWIRSWL